jgi:hypothetical protein
MTRMDQRGGAHLFFLSRPCPHFFDRPCGHYTEKYGQTGERPGPVVKFAAIIDG